jgi:hypothetical protein
MVLAGIALVALIPATSVRIEIQRQPLAHQPLVYGDAVSLDRAYTDAALAVPRFSAPIITAHLARTDVL